MTMRFLALISLCLTTLALPAQARAPVVVELFTAQGCASCGEANAWLGKLAERPDTLVLTFPVDYWDYLGWTDTFAKPEFADRQKAYVARMALREPYTPQVVIDGRSQAGGMQTDKVEALLTTAQRQPHNSPDIRFIGTRRADVGEGKVGKAGAEVWLVRFDPRQQDVAVKRGDNRGQTVQHFNVVREVHRLGTWRGKPTAYRLPKEGQEGLNSLILVQGNRGGRIVGVGLKGS